MPHQFASTRRSAAYALGGVRARLLATLDRARIHLQVDVGFGDVITPAAEHVTDPVLLSGPAPVLRGYPLATVVAEKVESLVAPDLEDVVREIATRLGPHMRR